MACERSVNYKILSWNKFAEMLYLWTSEEAIGKNIVELLSPDESKTVVKNNFNKLNKEGHWEGDFDVKRKDNTLISVHIINTYLKDITGNNIGYIGISTDITERKKTEQALLKTQNLLTETQRIAKVGSWEYELDKQKLTWSKEVYSIFGLDENHETTLEDLGKMIYPEDLWVIAPETIEKNTKTGIQEMEYRIVDQTTKKIKYVIGKGETEKNSDGVPVRNYGSFQDISERKKAEIIINIQNDELKKLNADKDRFIAILAHDLKNPFNLLLGFSDLLLKNLHKFDLDKIENQLKIIHQTTNKTYNLLEDLLLWSKSQSGKLQLEPQKIVFKEICDAILNNLLNQAIAKNISISFFEQERIILKGDVNMFKTIMLNLIANAIKFTNNKGEIKICAEKKHINATITVSDNGIGIGKDYQTKLWDFPQPISTSGTSGEKGTGFGLILCKEFVEKHNGKIWVESDLGKGSDFKFTMPLYDD